MATDAEEIEIDTLEGINMSILSKETRKFIPIRQRSNLVEIVLDGGGRIPDVLKGQFTSISIADKAIDLYEKGKLNGTSRGQSSAA